MPVWHKATKQARKDGTLNVVAITQEQHPERCRLFAQWQGLDFPILWDPFNVTGSRVVPRIFLIDEAGDVVSTRPRRSDLTTFLRAEAVDHERWKTSTPRAAVVQLEGTLKNAAEQDAWRAISALLWRGQPKPSAPSAFPWPTHLRHLATAAKADAAMQFRLGVALRMRADSDARLAGDFQAALDAWSGALSLNPRQYIWRRRIQQYGPRLDKPYPFYDWVKQAQTEVAARGETPIPLRAALTGSEIAQPSKEALVAGHKEPDPRRKIESAPDTVRVESAIAPHTGKDGTRVRLHVTLRAEPDGAFAFDVEAGEPVLWIGGTLVKPRNRERIETDGAARFELELDDAGKALRGYALYYGCVAKSGECRYLRHDFVIGR